MYLKKPKPLSKTAAAAAQPFAPGDRAEQLAAIITNLSMEASLKGRPGLGEVRSIHQVILVQGIRAVFHEAAEIAGTVSPEARQKLLDYVNGR